MRRSSYGVLDVYRFALTASLAEKSDTEGIEIAEEAFLVAYGPIIADISEHLSLFKDLIAAIDRSASRDGATHILFFKRTPFLERFQDAVDRDRNFLLLDYSNEAVESRLRLAEIAPYLARSLFASASDHSAEAVWRFLRELSNSQPQADTIHIFLNLTETALLSHPLLKLGDLLPFGRETHHV